MTFIQLSPQAVHKNNEGQNKLIMVLAKHSEINPILYDKNSSIRMKNLAYTSVRPSKEDCFLIFREKSHPPQVGRVHQLEGCSSSLPMKSALLKPEKDHCLGT